MAEGNIQLKEVTVPEEGSLASHATSSATWGTVYQKYISTNLSSEELGKGAYDAYNLLTAGTLDTFANAVCKSLSTLKENTDTLCTKVNSIEDWKKSEVKRRFTYIDDNGKALHPLNFPLDDYDNDCSGVYDLSAEEKISLAMYDAEQCTGWPGLLKGSTLHDIEAMSSKFMENWEKLLTDYDPEDLATGEFPGSWNKFSNISNNFFTGPLFTDYTETNLHDYFGSYDAPSGYPYSALGAFYSETSLSSLLVTQMNIIQSHLAYLSGVVNRMLTGSITFRKLSAALIQIEDQNTASEFAMAETTALADVPYLNPRAYKVERLW